MKKIKVILFTQLNKIKYYLVHAFKMFEDNSINLMPASLAFFIMWSIVPLFYVWDTITRFLPDLNLDTDVIDINELGALLDDIESFNPINGGNIIVFIVFLYLASKSFNSIISVSNYIYGFNDRTNFIKVRIKSIFFTILIMFTFIIIILLVVLGEQILELVENYAIINVVLTQIASSRLPLTITYTSISIFAIYFFAPSGKIRIRDVIPGTIVATLGWVIISFLYSIYLTYFASYTEFYSSFASIIILMIWIYLISYILIVGLVINATYFEEKKIEKIKESVEEI